MKYRSIYGSICENHLFSKVYSGGKKAAGKTLTVYALTDRKAALLRKRHPEKKKINRIGLTVSKKIGNAVVRTRARRLLREAYRLIERDCIAFPDVHPKYEMEKGRLLVFVARSSINGKKMPEIQAEMVKALFKLGVLRFFGDKKEKADAQTKTKGKEMTGF